MIKTIHAGGFKPLSRCTVRFSRLTCPAGLNGSGKGTAAPVARLLPVFFHDCGRFDFDDAIRHMKDGLDASGHDRDILMMPTGEAWILATPKAWRDRRGSSEDDAVILERQLKPNDDNPHCAGTRSTRYVMQN